MTQDNIIKTFLVVVLIIIVLLIVSVPADAQVNIPDGDWQVDYYTDTYLPMVGTYTPPVTSGMTCEITEQFKCGDFIETCTEYLSDNRVMICKIHWAVDLSVITKNCVILF